MQTVERRKALNGQTKIVTLLICLLPLFRYYIPGLKPLMFSDVAQMYLVFVGIKRKIVKRYTVHVPAQNALLLYGTYVVLATVCSAIYMPVFDYSSNITNILRLWVYIAIIILTIDSYFDKKFGFQIALKISIMNSCLTIVQLLLYKVFGEKTSFLIPFLDAEAGYSNEKVFNLTQFRPTGLFYEPAQSVYYCLPLMIIMMFSILNPDRSTSLSRTKKIIFSLIISIGIICSESGAGAVIVPAMWILFLIYYLIKCKNIKGLLMFALFLIALPLVFKLNFFTAALSRGTNLTVGSGSTRFLRGFLTWIQFPLRYKIFGIGYANYGVYVKFENFYTEYNYVQDVGYINAAGQILSGIGIIGFLFLLYFYIKTYRCCKNDLPAKIILCYLFFSMFYSSIFLGVYLIVFISYIFSRTKPTPTLFPPVSEKSPSDLTS